MLANLMKLLGVSSAAAVEPEIVWECYSPGNVCEYELMLCRDGEGCISYGECC